MTNKENEFKREKALLLQKVEFMQSEIEEYRHKDNETRKLNESIISSYKHTDHAREYPLDYPDKCWLLLCKKSQRNISMRFKA